MKILLTGVAGFLGSHLAHALVNQGHDVIGLKRRSSDVSRLATLKGALRLFDREGGLENLIANHPDLDLIIHAATSYGNQGESLSEILSSNVIMPLCLMELVQARKNLKFINTDTFFCKADEGYEYLADYVFSKKLFYQLGSKFAQKNQCAFVNVRLEHMYGPGDSQAKFITSIIKQMLESAPEIKLTPGGQLRDFIYIDDVVSAYLTIINSPEVLAKSGVSHFELGSCAVCSIKELVLIAHELIGSKSKLLFGALAYRENEIMSSRANLQELQKLGWCSRVDLKTGLKNVIASLQQEKM